MSQDKFPHKAIFQVITITSMYYQQYWLLCRCSLTLFIPTGNSSYYFQIASDIYTAAALTSAMLSITNSCEILIWCSMANCYWQTTTFILKDIHSSTSLMLKNSNFSQLILHISHSCFLFLGKYNVCCNEQRWCKICLDASMLLVTTVTVGYLGTLLLQLGHWCKQANRLALHSAQQHRPSVYLLSPLLLSEQAVNGAHLADPALFPVETYMSHCISIKFRNDIQPELLQC